MSRPGRRPLAGEVAGDHRLAAGDALLAGDRRVDLGAGDHLAVEHDGDPPRWVSELLAGRLAGQRGPAAAAVALELDRDLPAGLELGVELGAGVPDRVPGQGGRAEPQPAAVLVGQHQVPVAGRRGGRGRFAGGGPGQAQHRVEGELGRPADDLDGLLGVVDAGQLHDHPPLPRALQARLGHPQLVDPVAQHLKGAGHGVAGRPAVRGCPWLRGRSACRRAGQGRGGRGGWRPASRPLRARGARRPDATQGDETTKGTSSISPRRIR